MSSDRDVTRIVRAWLEEGVTRLPDPVLDQVLDQLPATRQRRRSWQAWRNILVSNPLKIATASAVALAVFVIGIGLYVGQSGGLGAGLGGVDPAAATPSPTPEPKALPDGTLEPGRYVIDEPFPVRITIDVPDGWSGVPGHSKAATVWKPTAGAPDYSTMIGFWVVDAVPSDPCSLTGGRSFGQAVDVLAQAVAGWPAEFDVTTPINVTLKGYEGQSLEFTVPDDTEDCHGGDLDMWQSGGTIRGANNGDHSQLWILDVDGTRLVIELVTSPEGTSDQDRAELREIFDSIQITRP
jgi:hypothetical protein